MISRVELTKLLQDRLSKSVPQHQIDELVSEILGLEVGWEEMDIPHGDMGYSTSNMCSEICWLSDQVDRGSQFKLYRRKKP